MIVTKKHNSNNCDSHNDNNDHNNGTRLVAPLDIGITGRAVRSARTQFADVPDKFGVLDTRVDHLASADCAAIACAPVCDKMGAVTGVLQAVRSQAQGAFAATNLDRLAQLAKSAAVALGSRHAVDELERRCSATHARLEEQQRLAAQRATELAQHETERWQVVQLGATEVGSMVEAAERRYFEVFTRCVHNLLPAAHVQLFVGDASRGELWSVVGGSMLRVPARTGLLGYCARTGETIHMSRVDLMSDPRADAAIDAVGAFNRCTRTLASMHAHTCACTHARIRAQARQITRQL